MIGLRCCFSRFPLFFGIFFFLNRLLCLFSVFQQGLSSLVLRKKKALIAAFTQVDKDETGYVTKSRWCQVMENVSEQMTYRKKRE